MKHLVPYVKREDARGRFVGLTQEAWAEVNLVTTLAGAMRGAHWHESTREMFCILSGTVDVEVESVATGERLRFTAVAGDLFVVEPFELHTFHARSDAAWLNFLSRPFDAAHPDFHVRSESAR